MTRIIALLVLLVAPLGTADARFGVDPRFTNNTGPTRWRGTNDFAAPVSFEQNVTFNSEITLSVPATSFSSTPLEGDGAVGTPFTLTSCSEGEIYKFSSGVWTCSPDAGGVAEGDSPTWTGTHVHVNNIDVNLPGQLATDTTAQLEAIEMNQDGSALDPAFYFASDPTMGFYTDGVGELKVTVNQIEVANFMDGVFEVTGEVRADDFTGLASLATALSANPPNCAAGQAPLGVDASGAAEGCFAVAGTGDAVTWLGSHTYLANVRIGDFDFDPTEVSTFAVVGPSLFANLDQGASFYILNPRYPGHVEGLQTAGLVGNQPRFSTLTDSDLSFQRGAVTFVRRSLSGGAVASGHRIGEILWNVNDGTGGMLTLLIRGETTELQSGTNQGNVLNFLLTPAGTASTSNMLQIRDNQLRLQDGTEAAPSLSFQNETGSGMSFNSGSSLLTFGVGGVIVSTIAATSEFGLVEIKQHFGASDEATQPTFSSCGGSPSFDGPSGDLSGGVVIGTGSPGFCTVTFATAYMNPPRCFAEGGFPVLVDKSSVTATTTDFTVHSGDTGLDGAFSYGCYGR